MATAKRPARPRAKQKVGKLVEALPFLGEIDEMLIENVPSSIVAQFIQHDKGELTDINPESLANALTVRRRQKQETDGWWGAPQSTDWGEDDDLRAMIKYRRLPATPGRVARSLYKRAEGGVKDMLELEASYLVKRDRCDRMLELEALSGAFSDITTRALDSMDETLWKRIQAQAKLNQGKPEGIEMSLSIKNYSQETMEVLSNPESRHRIMSLLERMTRFGKARFPLPSETLPLPRPASEE